MSPTASLECPPAIVLIETTRAVLNNRMRAKFMLKDFMLKDIEFIILNPRKIIYSDYYIS
jgi:hypothetical protein